MVLEVQGGQRVTVIKRSQEERELIKVTVHLLSPAPDKTAPAISPCGFQSGM